MHMQGDEPRRAFAVAHNHLRQFERNKGERAPEDFESRFSILDFRISGEPIREHDHGIVRAHVAIHGDAIEALRDRHFQRALESIRFDCGIAGDEREHRRVLHANRPQPVRSAIPGLIIPAPLQIPPMRTARLSILNSTAISLRRVSVVMIASATCRAFVVDLASSGAHSRIPRSTFFIGIGTPIRPVEQTSTSSALILL